MQSRAVCGPPFSCSSIRAHPCIRCSAEARPPTTLPSPDSPSLMLSQSSSREDLSWLSQKWFLPSQGGESCKCSLKVVSFLLRWRVPGLT